MGELYRNGNLRAGLHLCDCGQSLEDCSCDSIGDPEIVWTPVDDAGGNVFSLH